jgi:tetratricopeptide (TPR) repeat protein
MLLTGLAQTPALDVVSSQRLHEVVRDTGVADLYSLDRNRAAEVARRAGAGAAVVGSIMRVGTTIRIDAQVEDLSRGQVLAATTVSGTNLFALVDQLSERILDSVGVRETGSARSVAEVSSRSLEAYRLYAEGVDAFFSFRSDSAQRLLEQAVGIDPMFAEAYLQLALIAGPAGHPGDRRGYLRKAAEHAERLSDRRRLVMEAELARDEGRFPDATRRLDELIAKFPDVEAISTLAMQLHTPVVGPLPDTERLLDVQRRAVASIPTSAYARNNFAYALLYAGRFDDAIRELETAARLAPRQPGPHDGLGEAYLMMGSPERAIESFSRALTIDSTFPFSRRGRAWTLAVLGRFDEAFEERISAPQLTAVMLARVGRFREASETLSAAVQSAKEEGDNARQAGLHLVSAMLAMEQEDYEQAVEQCVAAERILTTVPAERARFISALRELLRGVTEVRRGRLTEARTHLEGQRRLYPSTPDVWWQRALEGEIALAAGDLDQAVAAFSEAAPPRKQFFSGLVEGSLLSNDLIFRDGLARVAIAKGDLQLAVGIYRRLLSYSPDQKWVAIFEPRYVLEIARLLEQIGDKRGARAEYERFLEFWKRADADRTERSEAQRALNRSRIP